MSRLGPVCHEDAPALLGRTVGNGRFEVLGELGRGGMGEVYLARDDRSCREVALKVIAARYVGRSEREQRFRNEAEYAQRVGGHCHVVAVDELGTLDDCDDRLFMTMERIEGPTLAMELAMQERLALPRAVTWARQVADGLAAIHAAGIVHRDLSPANILIERGSECAKIFDFGLASEMDAPVSSSLGRLTLLGEVPGTHGYMAPEQVSQGAPSGTMDVYAFGAVLTEMLVGHNPFAHLDREEYIDWQQTSRDETPSIRRWGLALPEGLVGLIDDCLRRNPAQRPRDGAALLARLDALTPAPVVALVPVHPLPPVVLDEVSDDASTIEARIVEPRPRRWSWRVAVEVLVGVVLLLVGVAIGRGSHPTLGGVPVAPRRWAPSPSVVRGEPVQVTSTGLPRTADVEAVVEREPGSPPLNLHPTVRNRSGSMRRAPARLSCKARRARADDAEAGGDWPTVLDLTRNQRCWPQSVHRMRLRVHALSETGQYVPCLELATGSEDPEVSKWRAQCERGLWTPQP
ncbi:MAG: serine/threonine protein kinase [Deltaproteobacteria bacterium]|nr:serine/threonine protein kinase [Deltaproteobacteria bacterium]